MQYTYAYTYTYTKYNSVVYLNIIVCYLNTWCVRDHIQPNCSHPIDMKVTSVIFSVFSFVAIISHIMGFNIKTKPSSKNYRNNGNFFWKIGKSHDFVDNNLRRIIFNEYPYCVYRDANNEIVCVSDICVHRAASLSHGSFIKSSNSLQCPYHGWEYSGGLLQQMPGCPSTKKNCFGLPRFETREINDDVYIAPTYDINGGKGFRPVNNITVIPEASSKEYVRVSGKKHIVRPHSLITENVLDMMHVSYVHSFGNRMAPVPFEIKYTDIDELSGRTTFFYTAGQNSMSSVLGKAEFVRVENEFYLPDMTVTRVYASETLTKTIVTHCYPIGKNESILHYDLYRNFLTPRVFDPLFNFQMDLTLKEDVDILNVVYDKHMLGFMSNKFDITQTKYRAKMNRQAKLLEDIDEMDGTY